MSDLGLDPIDMPDEGLPHPSEADMPPPVVLTQGQQFAVTRLVEVITNRMNSLYKALLEGWAGTGKTFTINRVVEAIKAQNPRINFGMTAPTHKAVRQLRKHSELKDQLDFGTIHSFLGLKEVLKPDPKNPHKQIVKYELDWVANKERRIDGIDVLIVDESSMLGDELYDHIDDVCRMRPDLKVIFMGDNLQIPPVGKKKETGVADAIPFIPSQRHSRRIEHLVLSEVVRQKNDNPIIAYSAAIRQQYLNQSINFNFEGCDLGDTGVQVLRKENGIKPLRDLFLKYFDTPEFQNDPDYVKVIAWRNNTVDYFNREIRLILYKADTLPKIIENEKLILDEPVMKGEKILLPNNEEIDIVSVTVGEHMLRYKLLDHNSFLQAGSDGIADPTRQLRELPIKVYFCKATTAEDKMYDLIILHEDSEAEFNQVHEMMATAAQKLSRQGQVFESKEQWREFYKFKKPFAWVKYNYCLTAHKAQGSTYDYCISMEWDIDEGRKIVGIEEANRIRYVAATRARHKLFIVK
jgi:exodeoxyribonuclease-5